MGFRFVSPSCEKSVNRLSHFFLRFMSSENRRPASALIVRHHFIGMFFVFIIRSGNVGPPGFPIIHLGCVSKSTGNVHTGQVVSRSTNVAQDVRIHFKSLLQFFFEMPLTIVQ